MTTSKEEVLRLAEEAGVKIFKRHLGSCVFRTEAHIGHSESLETIAKLIEIVRKESIVETYASCMKLAAKSQNTRGYSVCCVNAVGKVWRELEQAKFSDLMSESKQS